MQLLLPGCGGCCCCCGEVELVDVTLVNDCMNLAISSCDEASALDIVDFGAFLVAINTAAPLVLASLFCVVELFPDFSGGEMWLGLAGGGMLSMASLTVAASMRSAESPTNWSWRNKKKKDFIIMIHELFFQVLNNIIR